MTTPKERWDIESGYKWDLDAIFSDLESWELAAKELTELLPELSAFQGKLNTAQNLEACLNLKEEIDRALEKLYVYAQLKSDEDTRDSTGQALRGRAISLAAKTQAASAFLEPELLKLGDKLFEFSAQRLELARYLHYFQEIVRHKPHTLSKEEEELLALSREPLGAPGSAHSVLTNADLKFEPVRDGGEIYPVTNSTFTQLMQNKKPEVRKAAFRSLYQGYEAHQHTLASLLDHSVKADLFYTKARRHPSTVEGALFDDKIPFAVYESLLAAVEEALPMMYHYQELRREILELKEIASSDLYLPLYGQVFSFSYEEAQKILLEALAPLGEEYGKILEEAFSSGWIDVYESAGKRSGAYAWGSYDTHPYVLLNYQEGLEGLYTLAHELGHALHSYYSNRAQPYIYADYTIFLAEIASTVNEVLLTRYLLANFAGEEYLSVLNYYLEQFRTTVFRQTMFAEFELEIHQEVSKGGTLTAESLGERYLALNRKYYGPDFLLEPELAFEWARIPHFYRSFYVYKYATGFSAAVALVQEILKGGAEKYHQFLAAGSSDYSLEILKRQGLDLTTGEPFQNALADFSAHCRILAEAGGR